MRIPDATFKKQRPNSQEPQTKPSAWMLLTHSSNLAISVSSSQGFTSSKMEDLATSAGSKKSMKSSIIQILNIIFYPSPRNVSKWISSLATQNYRIYLVFVTHMPAFCFAKKEVFNCVTVSFPQRNATTATMRNSCRPVAVEFLRTSREGFEIPTYWVNAEEITLGINLWKRLPILLWNEWR